MNEAQTTKLNTAVTTSYRMISCVSYIRDRTRRTFLFAAVAMVDAPIGIYNDRNRSFLLIIHTMRTEIDAGAALHTSQNVDNRIPVFSHFLFLSLHKQILNRVEEVADNNDTDCTNRNEDAQQLRLYRLTEHDHRRQR